MIGNGVVVSCPGELTLNNFMSQSVVVFFFFQPSLVEIGQILHHTFQMGINSAKENDKFVKTFVHVLQSIQV